MPDRESRARDRSLWPVRVVRGTHGEHPSASTDTTTAEQRLAMMWELVVQAWAIAGKAIPQYARHETPVRVLRGESAR